MFPGSKVGADGRLVVSGASVVSYNAGFGYAADQALAMTVSSPPPADPYWANVTLLALNDNKPTGTTTFVDQSSFAHPLIAGGAMAYSDVSAPAGMTTSGRFYFYTKNRIESPASADWQFTGDFTIEGMVNFESFIAVANRQALASWTGGDGTSAVDTSYMLELPATGKTIGWRSSTSGGGLSGIVTNPWTPVTAQWYHVAISCIAGVGYQFVDGVRQPNSGSVPLPLFNSSELLRIGRTGTFDLSDFTGYMSNVRITKGVARYSANFTPPALPLPSA